MKLNLVTVSGLSALVGLVAQAPASEPTDTPSSPVASPSLPGVLTSQITVNRRRCRVQLVAQYPAVNLDAPAGAQQVDAPNIPAVILVRIIVTPLDRRGELVLPSLRLVAQSKGGPRTATVIRGSRGPDGVSVVFEGGLDPSVLLDKFNLKIEVASPIRPQSTTFRDVRPFRPPSPTA